MLTLPTGVVTFLFSDIEASTRMLEDHRGAAGSALARHHDLLAAAIDANGGVVFETVGDAVYGAFTGPADALAAAVAIHRALAVEDWGEIGTLRCRIAIHSGAVETRGDHYFGPALFETARLQALAHGGQTLTSAATASLAAASLPEDIALSPLGRHRLKDLATPMDVVQVDGEGLPTQFPPLRQSEGIPNNLPAETTAFIGRADDLARLDDLVAKHRLVTLLGPGGTGKTRLALQAATRHLERFADGVWLVELAHVGSPDRVIAAFADVWGLRSGEGSTLEEVLTRYLGLRHLLLVVDNCEHVREATATLVGELLRAAPKLTILATSRESLGVPGEAEVRVPALALPPDAADVASATASDAVRLFLDRVRTSQPGFDPTNDDLAAIVHVCRRLDGMPLGLELAAARLRSLSARELADRLDTSFRVLGGSKTAPDRQRTLQATLDWSHDLLGPDEQVLFRRLSIFAGGFDVAAAEAVCAADPVEDWQILDLLDSLVDKSLVLAVPGPRARFRLLEPVRQYAAEKLREAGEHEAVASAHARHFAAFIAEAAPHTRGPEQMAWERRIDLDYANVRAAFDSMLEAGDLDRYLEMGFDLFIYWMHLGLHMEGVATLLAGLERAPAGIDRLRLVKAWATVASLGAEITDPAAIGHASSGLEVARELGDRNAIGHMELRLGAAIRHATTDPAYLEHLLEGRRLLEAHPEPHWWEPEWERALLNLILAAYLPNDDERIQEHVKVALDGFEAVGDQALLAATLGDSAGLLGIADEDWVMANLYRSVEILGSIEVPYWEGHALLTLGSILERRGEMERSIEYLSKAVPQLQDMGDLNCWGGAMRRLATAEAERGEVGSARQRLAATIEAMPLLPMQELVIPRTFDAAAEILLASGQLEPAAFTLGRAIATEFPVETIFPREPRQDAVREKLAARLGADATATLMADGAAATIDDALARIGGWLRPVG